MNGDDGDGGYGSASVASRGCLPHGAPQHKLLAMNVLLVLPLIALVLGALPRIDIKELEVITTFLNSCMKKKNIKIKMKLPLVCGSSGHAICQNFTGKCCDISLGLVLPLQMEDFYCDTFQCNEHGDLLLLYVHIVFGFAHTKYNHSAPKYKTLSGSFPDDPTYYNALAPHLKSFVFEVNSLTGTFPSQVALLTNLETL